MKMESKVSREQKRGGDDHDECKLIIAFKLLFTL